MQNLAQIYKSVPLILVVEDEEDLRAITCMTLQNMGAKTLEAENVEQGLEILQSKKVSLVICDIKLTGKSGMELLTRCNAQGISTPFVFFTGYDQSDYLIQAIRPGAYDFILKPLAVEEFSLVVGRVLAISHRQGLMDGIINDLGDTIDPEVRKSIDDLKRQIAMIRTMLVQ